MKKFLSLLLVFVMLLGVLCSCNDTDKNTNIPSDDSEKEARYNEALGLIDKGDYISAYEIFKELGNYKDSSQQCLRFQYIPVKRVISYDDVEIIGEITLNENNLPIHITNRKGAEEQIFDFSYDEVGNLIQQAFTGYNSKTVYDYNYDDENRLVREAWTFVSGDGAVNVYYYEYDDRGNLIKELASYSSGSVQIKEYKYDSSDKLTQKSEMSYFEDFTYKTKYDYTYDAKGNIIKEVQPYEDGRQNVFEFVYDDNGNLLKRIQTVYRGLEELSRWVYECNYDKNGNLIREIYTDSDGDVEIYDMVYDADGNLIEGGHTAPGADREIYRTAYYEDGKLIKDVYTESVTEYTYDENGNIKKLNRSKAQGSEVLVEYEYKFVYIGYDLPQAVAEEVEYFRDNWYSYRDWFRQDKG